MGDFYTYIMSNKRNGTLYVGATNDLVRRVYEHKEGLAESHTKKYALKKLVYYEIHSTPEEAIRREKRLKKYNRGWKLDLIEQNNPDWKDLYEDIV